MIANRKQKQRDSQRESWREYQHRLQLAGSAPKKHLLKVFVAYAALCLLILISVYLIPHSPDSAAYQKDLPPPPKVNILKSRAELHRLLEPERLFNPPAASFDLQVDDTLLRVDTSLDLELQEYLLKKMSRKHSRYIGIVVMEPETGRVLALAGFNKIDPIRNPCIDGSYPAASIFKIVTAAAAVEAAGLSPDSPLVYNGRKHTLYKKQLTSKTNKYTHRTTLKDSFAKSINPVFGKLGSQRLGRDELRRYADTFGFNQVIPFDLAVEPSRVALLETPYQWAEIASGFNRETTLSPIHGAVMAAMLVNSGKMVAPTVIDRITDPDGRLVYSPPKTGARQALTPETSRAIMEMMAATIRSGTARKAFRGYRRDKILSQLAIGGKTGSIFNKTRDARFDWFVGYAGDEKTGERIAVSVVVAHVEYIGTRASQYARMVMRRHFKQYYDGLKKAQAESQNPAAGDRKAAAGGAKLKAQS